jgi:hypothetical protein
VIQHPVCDARVEATVVVGNRASVDLLKVEMADRFKVSARVAQHAERKIRQRDVPSGLNSIVIGAPQRTDSAAELQDTRIRRKREMIEDPSMERVAIGAEAPVEAEAG